MMNEAYAAAAALAVLSTAIVEGIKKPLAERYPQWDLWWFVYVGFAVGIGLNWLAQINAFASLLPGTPGVIATGFLVGGGSTLLYDVVIGPQQARQKALRATAQEVNRGEEGPSIVE